MSPFSTNLPRSGARGELGSVRGRPRSIRKAAFSIVELLLAMGVLAVALGAALRAQLQAAELTRCARETETASSDLQSCMELILATPHDSLPVAGSPFEHGAPVAAFEDAHLSAERIVPTYPEYVVGGSVPDPLEIELTITWNDREGRPRQLSLVSTSTR